MNTNTHQKEMVNTARMTGVWYLLLAIAGMFGFLILHSRIYVASDPPQTLTNLVEQESIARIRLLFEFLIVLSQALAAVWFYKLFKDIRHDAAWALAAWGMMNAVAIMISAVAMGGAIEVAAGTQTLNEKILMIQIFNQFIKNSWGVGSLFFGLWLIPMGYVVVSSQRMPVWLGRVLIFGGAGYILNAFTNYMGIKGVWVDFLTIPATIGEFWMIIYLLAFGIRPSPNSESAKR